MAMKTDIEPLGTLHSLIARTGQLRIAVPSWRWSVIEFLPEARKAPKLSREEIVSLFEGELRSKRRRPQLTEREQNEQAHAGDIRRALYPS